jgi:hypothetical protein
VPRPVAPHRKWSSQWLGRFIGLTLLTAILVAPALAQPSATPPRAAGNAARQPTSPAGAAGQRPPAAQAGQAAQPAGQAAQPGSAAGNRQPAAAGGQPSADAPRRPADSVEIDAAPDQAQPTGSGRDRLPPDFTPPGPKPEWMELRKPLMTNEEITREQNELNRARIQMVIQAGDPTNENKALLRRWARWQIARMTAVDDWSKLNDINRDIMLLIRNAAMRQQNDNRKQEFRQALCEAMTQACREVIRDNNFYVRIQAATILENLDVRPEELFGGNRRPPVSYVPAMNVLLDVLEDDQPEALKIAAARGVTRIAEYADIIDANDGFRAANVLIGELSKNDTHWWYQMRLAEALTAIKVASDAQRQPIVVNALLNVISDENRQCQARAAAAKALARVPLQAGALDERDAAERLVRFAHHMSLNYNRAPSRNHWFQCYADLYLAFRPEAQEDLQRLPQNSLLRRGSLPAPMNEAFQRITPLVNHVLSQLGQPRRRPIPTEAIQRLEELLPAATGQAANR